VAQAAQPATAALDARPPTAADYQPPRWLRSPHMQSVLGSSPLRRRRGAKALQGSGAVTSEHLIDGGDGTRLHGLYSQLPGAAPRGLALLLHGWEGSAESSYMRMTAAQLLQCGFATFRLNFRDHGDTHHLNEALFHSNRIDEVVHAAGEVARGFLGDGQPMVAAGYSLGGNFALRLALRAPAAGLPLARVAAVCPVLDPALTMEQMERGLPLYLRYFERKWRRSLLRKRALFPQQHDFDDATLKLSMRELTRWMVERHTDFGTLDAYFEGYSIAGERMAALQVPADILMAEDDPVIPVAEFRALRLPASAHLDIARWGGHCGFLQNARLDGFAEHWVAGRVAPVLTAR
jgi:predicted alpha/beta-fold hydrolase